MATEKTTVWKPMEALLGYGIAYGVGLEKVTGYRWLQRRGTKNHVLGLDCEAVWISIEPIMEAVCNS